MVGFPASARALPTGTVFDVVVTDGPDPSDGNNVGTLWFRLASDLGPAGCRYSAAWESLAHGSFVTPCTLDEMKTHGHASCTANSEGAFNTLVVKGSRAACSYLDPWGQQQDLFMLIGAESADPAGIRGVLQWSAAAPLVSAFDASPSP